MCHPSQAIISRDLEDRNTWWRSRIIPALRLGVNQMSTGGFDAVPMEVRGRPGINGSLRYGLWMCLTLLGGVSIRNCGHRLATESGECLGHYLGPPEANCVV